MWTQIFLVLLPGVGEGLYSSLMRKRLHKASSCKGGVQGEQGAHWPVQGGAASGHPLPDWPRWCPEPGASGRRRAGCPGRASGRQLYLSARRALRVGAAVAKYQLFIRKMSGMRHAWVVTFCRTARPDECPHSFRTALWQQLSGRWGADRCALLRGAREPHAEAGLCKEEDAMEVKTRIQAGKGGVSDPRPRP